MTRVMESCTWRRPIITKAGFHPSLVYERTLALLVQHKRHCLLEHEDDASITRQ